MPPETSAGRNSETLLSFGSVSVFRWLLAMIAILVLASTAGQISKYIFDHGQVFGLVRLFFLDSEQAIPAYFSSLQLLAAAAILVWISHLKRRSGDRFSRHWLGLAFGFAFLSIDENCSIHETLTLGNTLPIKSTGLLFFAWVVPAGIGVITIGLIYLRFLFHLPPPVRNGFILAAALFLGGAVGVELFEGRHAEQNGFQNLGFAAYVTLEESFEMIGIALFIRTLLRYAENTYGGIVFSLGDRQTAPGTPR